MTTAIEKLELDLDAFNPPKERTRYLYRRLCNRFLCDCPVEPPTADDIRRFLAGCQAQAHKRWAYTIIKRLFEANGWDWPLPKRAAPRLRGRNQVVAPLDHVKTLIRSRARFTPRQQALLALSTTYGLRREEMSQLVPGDLDDGHLVVNTLKHGRPTTHLVPAEISEPLEGLQFGTSRDAVTREFQAMCRLAGIKRLHREGWHSIRHRLVTELATSHNAFHVGWFMRWQPKRFLGMMEIPETMAEYAHLDQEVVDRAIFEGHPFLPLWRTS